MLEILKSPPCQYGSSEFWIEIIVTHMRTGQLIDCSLFTLLHNALHVPTHVDLALRTMQSPLDFNVTHRESVSFAFYNS